MKDFSCLEGEVWALTVLLVVADHSSSTIHVSHLGGQWNSTLAKPYHAISHRGGTGLFLPTPEVKTWNCTSCSSRVRQSNCVCYKVPIGCTTNRIVVSTTVAWVATCKIYLNWGHELILVHKIMLPTTSDISYQPLPKTFTFSSLHNPLVWLSTRKPSHQISALAKQTFASMIGELFGEYQRGQVTPRLRYLLQAFTLT